MFFLLPGTSDSSLEECPLCVFTLRGPQSSNSWPDSIILLAPKGKSSECVSCFRGAFSLTAPKGLELGSTRLKALNRLVVLAAFNGFE